MDALFKQQFRYETRIVQLSDKKPQHHLLEEMSAFARTYDGPNNLLIIYYTGHSRFDKNTGVLVFYP